MSKYCTQVVTKVEDIDKKRWNSVVEGNDGTVFHTYEWLKTHEIGGTSKFLPFYIMVFKDERLIGVAPFYLTTYCPRLELYRRNLLLDQGKVFNEPILLGHTLHGQYSQILAIEDRRTVIGIILDILYDICKENGCRVFGLPMVHKSDTVLLSELRKRNYLTKYFNSVNRLYIEWNNMDDYYHSFKRKSRHKIKKIIGDCENKGLFFVEGNEKITTDDIAALSEKTCRYHNSPIFFTKHFLDCIMDGLKPYVKTASVVAGDKVIGSSVLLLFNNVLTPWVIGLDYEYLKQYNHYNYLCLKWIEYAIANNVRRIEFGRGTFYIKAKYGCKQEEIFISLKGLDDESNVVIENWVSEIEKSSLKSLNDFHQKIGRS